MKTREKIAKLYGLVLVGGKSSRMACDKAFLMYHGKPQALYSYELLQQFCRRVYVSNRSDQVRWKSYPGLLQIPDDPNVAGHGPLSGIISAMTKFPKVAWLVLACDLPFVDDKILTQLIEQRDVKKIATAFRCVSLRRVEPLCAIYEPQSRLVLTQSFQEKLYCPRKILLKHNIKLIAPLTLNKLANINTAADYEQFQAGC
jgi:molybdenum cofactor guanylyltransferase